MTKRERTAAATVLGLLIGWLALLDTGLVHRGDVAGLALQGVVILASIGAAWLLLWLVERYGKR